MWEPGLKTKSVLTIEPKQTRMDIAGRLRAMGVDAFILESQTKRAAETHTAFFFRTINDEDVQTFLAYWLLGPQEKVQRPRPGNHLLYAG